MFLFSKYIACYSSLFRISRERNKFYLVTRKYIFFFFLVSSGCEEEGYFVNMYCLKIRNLTDVDRHLWSENSLRMGVVALGRERQQAAL